MDSQPCNQHPWLGSRPAVVHESVWSEAAGWAMSPVQRVAFGGGFLGV